MSDPVPTFERELNENEANVLAQRILESDESILRVGIVSHVGFRLGGATRSIDKKRYEAQKDELEKRALRVGDIMASAKAGDKFLSPTECVILVRRQSKTILCWVARYALIIVITLPRNVPELPLLEKVRTKFYL